MIAPVTLWGANVAAGPSPSSVVIVWLVHLEVLLLKVKFPFATPLSFHCQRGIVLIINLGWLWVVFGSRSIVGSISSSVPISKSLQKYLTLVNAGGNCLKFSLPKILPELSSPSITGGKLLNFDLLVALVAIISEAAVILL